jgi:hypothetical protein
MVQSVNTISTTVLPPPPHQTHFQEKNKDSVGQTAFISIAVLYMA